MVIKLKGEKMTILEKYEIDLNDILDKEYYFDKSDDELKQWLINADIVIQRDIYHFLADYVFSNSNTDSFFELGEDKDWNLNKKYKEYGAIILVQELKCCLGHSLNIFFKKPHYKEGLTKLYSKVTGKKTALTLKKMEYEIADTLFDTSSFYEDDLDYEELYFILNLNSDVKGFLASQFKKGAKDQIVQFMIEQIPKKFLKGALKRVGVKSLASLAPYMWIYTAFDIAVDLGGEATRITRPLLTYLSAVRVLYGVKNRKRKVA